MSSTKSGPNRTNFLSVLVVCILQTRIDCMLKTCWSLEWVEKTPETESETESFGERYEVT